MLTRRNVPAKLLVLHERRTTPPDRGGRSTDQSTRPRDQRLPPAAPAQPGRLVSVGRGGPRASAGGGPAAARVDWLQRLSLVPRHGARVLRESGDRRTHERGVRLHQGRSRGTTRRRPDLHGHRAQAERPGRLASERHLHAGRSPLLRGHLLPARAARPDAGLPRGDRGPDSNAVVRSSATQVEENAGTRSPKRSPRGPRSDARGQPGADPRPSIRGRAPRDARRRRHPRRVRPGPQVPDADEPRVPDHRPRLPARGRGPEWRRALPDD